MSISDIKNFAVCLQTDPESYEWCLQPHCLKGRVVCGTVYGEMHLRDLLGPFVISYRIPVPDFYLVLHGLRCRKSTIMD